MRHRIKGTTTFGRRKAQRKALLNNLVASLVIQNRINTTLIKAKEVSKIADKLVTLGKKDSIHARRLAYKILRNRDLIKKLFEEISIRYKNRNGGYTRIIKTGYRRGDSAPIAIIEFVEEEKKSKEKAKSNSKAKSMKKQIRKKDTDIKKVIKNQTEPNSEPSKSNETPVKNNTNY